MFLRSSAETIAAIIVPRSAKAYIKDSALIKDAALQLSKADRASLLEHRLTLLRRFAWIYHCTPNSAKIEISLLHHKPIACAAREGFHIEFVTLWGSDHFDNVQRNPLGLEM